MLFFFDLKVNISAFGSYILVTVVFQNDSDFARSGLQCKNFQYISHPFSKNTASL
jgi:hypothetical protein